MATASLGKEALGREFGAMRPNILLITADQWRGDSYGAAGHPVVRTPAIDALTAEGVCFLRHFSQAAPCSPGRASLYTGLYQMNHRVLRNGTPLRSEEHTSELQSLMRISYAVFCLKKKTHT